MNKAAGGGGSEIADVHSFTGSRPQRENLSVGDFPAVLTVSLRTVEHPTTVLAYCLEVDVRQVVHITRTSQIRLLAPTWANGTLTMVTRAGLVRSVEGALAGLLDDLVRDYRLVNQNP